MKKIIITHIAAILTLAFALCINIVDANAQKQQGIEHTTLRQSSVTAKHSTQYIVVSGTVKDDTNNKRIAYAHVALAGSSVGTVTNQDGEFTLKIKRDTTKTQAVDISHPGYRNTRIKLKNNSLRNIVVKMKPTTDIVMLDEIIVRGGDPKYIVQEAVKKIQHNYPDNNTLLTGFYRETAQKGKKYVNISEAVINVFKTPYNQNADKDRVQIRKGRSLLSQKASDTLAVKLLGGPNLAVHVDVVKNPWLLLDPEVLEDYHFTMDEPTTVDNKQHFVIDFQPKVVQPYALYHGKLFVNMETLAFTRAEFQLDMNDTHKATNAILRKKPQGLKFKPLEVAFLVTYKERNGVTYLHYIRNDVRFRCDWKQKLFATTYRLRAEMVVTESKMDNVTNIPYKMAFKTNQALADQVKDFTDANFWGRYNTIEPTQSLENAVGKLKKQ